MSFSSFIQILKVDEVKRGTSAKTGKPFEIHTVQVALLTDDGAIDKVGMLRLSEGLRDKAKVGTFSATFGLDVPSYGLTKGEVTAMLTGLVPVPTKGAPAAK